MGTLYLVATPIGNLEDITLRALRILKEVKLIAAEDTRRTRILLDHYQIATPMTSYFEHNKLRKLPEITQALATGDVALVSEAGMPGISDPGYELVKAAVTKGFPVVPVPGPSALTAALAASGLPAESFLFLGFLPRKTSERRGLLQNLAAEPRSIVAFEAPHRLRSTLEDIEEIMGDREIAVARELTKIHEEIRRGRASEIRTYYEKNPPRGEFTLIIAGAKQETWDEKRIANALARLRRQGRDGQGAVREIAQESGRPKNQVYKIWLKIKEQRGKGR